MLDISNFKDLDIKACLLKEPCHLTSMITCLGL